MDRGAALVAASSSAWQERAAAAGVLATLEDEEAGTAMNALLIDDDLAVVKRASSLLAHSTFSAVARFTSVYAAADDQVGDAMNDQLGAEAALNPGLLTISGARGARILT